VDCQSLAGMTPGAASRGEVLSAASLRLALGRQLVADDERQLVADDERLHSSHGGRRLTHDYLRERPGAFIADVVMAEVQAREFRSFRC
jgi:hypothetical protein